MSSVREEAAAQLRLGIVYAIANGWTEFEILSYVQDEVRERYQSAADDSSGRAREAYLARLDMVCEVSAIGPERR